MFRITIFIFALYVTTSFGRPQNGQSSDDKKDIQITKFHVNTDIQMSNYKDYFLHLTKHVLKY